VKRYFLPGITAVLLLIAMGAPASCAEPDPPLALVNGHEVSLAQYRRFLLKLQPGTPPEGVDKEVLKKLIEETLILQRAKEKGISSSEEEVQRSIQDFLKENDLTEKAFEEQIAGHGMSMGEYRTWLKENIIVLAKAVHEEVDSLVSVNEEEIGRYYALNRESFSSGPERFRIKAIFLRLGEAPSLAEVTALKMKALRISSELRGGTGFDRLAAEYPENTLKAHDGVLGEFRKGDLVAELDTRISSMKAGDISGPVWLREGVYIIKLEERVVEMPPLSEVRQEIATRLAAEKRAEAYREWVRKLWEAASITIY